MTRSRATRENIPSPLAPRYYAQRATAGMIITEATQVSPQGIGYINTPGIHNDEQIEAWAKVTDVVHSRGGVIFLQLWHVGAISHPFFHGGQLPVAPSAVNPEREIFTPKGREKSVVPRALKLEEIEEIVDKFRQGAENAHEAGFDGVEIHGANGYLPNQFLHSRFNQRTDQYGGSIENRARFLLEITDAAIEIFDSDRVAVRLSPQTILNGGTDETPEETFGYVADQLDAREVAYLHLLEPLPGHRMEAPGAVPIAKSIRERFQGPIMLNGGYNLETGNKAIQSGIADLVSFGVLFLANPDLPERFRTGAPLNEADQATFYTSGERGYTDYPTL